MPKPDPRPSPEQQQLLNKVVAFYQKAFAQEPEGRAYLHERGLTDPALYATFCIGLASGSIFEAIPPEGDVLEDLKAIGILDDRGREHFRDCVVFPVFDAAGNVSELYGRKIHRACHAKGVGKLRHLYLPGPHRGIWNAAALRRPEDETPHRAGASFFTVLLTESILDAAAIWQAGWKQVIPCYGVMGFNAEHLALLEQSQVDRLVLVMDGDNAGRKAAARVRQKLEACPAIGGGSGIDIRELQLPEGDDPAEFLHANGAEAFGKLLSAACDEQTAQANPILSKTEIEPTPQGFRLTVENRCYEVMRCENRNAAPRATIKALTKDRIRFHIDTVDLHQARSRKSFAADAAKLYGVEPDSIALDLNRILEAFQTQTRQDAESVNAKKTPMHSPEAENEAQAFGKSPDLLNLLRKDIEASGYIGERANVLSAYLAMTSRKMLQPLAMLILSGSGAGKSALQDTVLSLCPEEDLVKVTSLTERALFYKDEDSLKHKVLALEEAAGAEDASYAIRSLISSGKLVIESTVKDPVSGRMTTMQNTVYGPTAVLQTTTNPNVDPETLSRFLVGSIDESRAQTRRILEAQRKARTVEGLRLKLKREMIAEKHHAFQRLLRPLDVRNPFGELLSYSDDRLLMRRDNPKYLALIEAVAFLHQIQKPVKTLKVGRQRVEYIEVSLRDIALANELAAEILGRSLDELSGPSRKLLQIIEEMVRDMGKHQNIDPGQVEFSRRQLREFSRWSDYQIRTHLTQLVDLEYLAAVSGRFGQQYQYRLLWDGQGREGGSFLLGLKPMDDLRKQAESLGILASLEG